MYITPNYRTPSEKPVVIPSKLERAAVADFSADQENGKLVPAKPGDKKIELRLFQN